MVEWSACWTRNPVVPGSSPALATSWLSCFSVVPRTFKSSATRTLVNSQLICLRPVEILNNVKFNLKYLFSVCSAPLALVL